MMGDTKLPRFFVGLPPFQEQIMERVKGGPIGGGITYVYVRAPLEIDFICDALNKAEDAKFVEAP